MSVKLSFILEAVELSGTDNDIYLDLINNEIIVKNIYFDDVRDIEDHWIYLDIEKREYKRLIRFSCLVKDVNQREVLRNAIEGKGAFHRFKYLIRKYNLLDSWHSYQYERDLELTIEFLEYNKIDYIKDI